MKDLQYFTESSSLIIADVEDQQDYTNCFSLELSDTKNSLMVVLEREDKPSLAKFLREAADELDRTKH